MYVYWYTEPTFPFFSHANVYDAWGFLQVGIMNETPFDEQRILKLAVTYVENYCAFFPL